MKCWRPAHRHFHSLHWLLLLFFNIIPISTTAPAQPKYTFRENCADEHDKDFLSCTVSMVNCDLDMEKLFPPPPASSADKANGFPGEGHDLRIEPFAKATTRLGSSSGTAGEGQKGRNANDHHHQLLVDISWQTAPNNSTYALRAFLLEIEGENGRKHACFLLNVSNTKWTHESIQTSPRLHFSADSLFSFGQNYEIELYSLPERSPGSGASVHSRFTSPHNPNVINSANNNNNDANGTAMSISSICSKKSSQFASKWTAGFRHIYVHSAARILQVEFVGAPPQYCFEQYEVRLLDETGLELLYSGTVSAEDMHQNGSILLGQYNFTDLQYDQSYIPSVIPVERASDGRCLCPVFGGTADPYDVKVVCSCVAADWRPVRMTRPDIVQLCPGCALNNSSALLLSSLDNANNAHAHGHDKTNILWILLLIFNGFFLLLILLLVLAYLRCRLNGTIPSKSQFQRIRFVPPSANGKCPSSASSCSMPPAAGMSNSLAIRTNLALGKVTASDATTASSSLSMPLIGNEEMATSEEISHFGTTTTASSSPPLNLLIVYAHDCPAHERAVLALANFLRDQFHINVQLDRWAIAQIEANQLDWLSASVVTADKVLIINSAGAWERYRAKITSQGRWVVEHKQADLLDHIFIAHIDMALQHHSIVSARFRHSRAEKTLPMLQGLLQYILPDNIGPLLSALFGKNMRTDGRLAGNEHLVMIDECTKEMERMAREEPNWIAESHQRRAIFEEEMMEIANKEAQRRRREEEEREDQPKMVMEMEVEEGENLTEHLEEHKKGLLEEEGQKVPIASIAIDIDGDNGTAGKMDSGIFEWAGSDEDSESGKKDAGERNGQKCMIEEIEANAMDDCQLSSCSSSSPSHLFAASPQIYSGKDEEADSGVITTEEESNVHDHADMPMMTIVVDAAKGNNKRRQTAKTDHANGTNNKNNNIPPPLRIC